MSSKIVKFLNVFLFVFIFFIPFGNIAAKDSSYYLERGKMQYRAGMYQYALHSLDRAFQRDPSLYEAANLIADIYIIQNNRFRAIEYLEKSIEVNENQPDALVLLGRQHEYFHNNRLAMEQFQKALKHDPDHIKANAFIVRHYIESGDIEAADEHFEISNREGLKAVQTFMERAERYKRNNNYDEAVRLYKIAINRAPALKDAYFSIYEINRLRQRPEETINILEKFKKIRPDYKRAYYLLGLIYFEERLPGDRSFNIEMSLRNLKRAVEIDSDYYQAHYELSNIYRILNDDIKSKEHFRLGREAERGKKDD